MDDAHPAEDTQPVPATPTPTDDPAGRPPAVPDADAEADDAEADAGSPGEEERPKPPRRTLILLITPIVILSTAGTIASAFTPALAARHPLLLISLDARNRMLVLAREVDLVPFVVVAFLRRSLSDPLFYLLGRLYGDRAIRWLEKKGGGGPLVTMTEGWFKKASYLMVFLFPGAIVCALAGATAMSPVAFAACNIAGTLASVILVRIFSDAISSPVEALLRFFDHHMVLTTSISVGLVILSLVLNKVQGRLDAGLDDLESDDEPDPAAG
jgi:membrane protein DedA with SNARE-associated domain